MSRSSLNIYFYVSSQDDFNNFAQELKYLFIPLFLGVYFTAYYFVIIPSDGLDWVADKFSL